MKIRLLIFFITALLTLPSLAAAEEWIQFDPVEFFIQGGRSLEAFESALDDMSRLSNTFRPTGAAISGRQVERQGPRGVPRVIFDARHGVGIFQKSARVRADIKTRRLEKEIDHRQGTYSYRIEVTTMDSDHLVAANVAAFEVILYVHRTHGGGRLDIIARGRMKKGYSYGRFAGPAIRNLIEAQIEPLLDALREVIGYYQRH